MTMLVIPVVPMMTMEMMTVTLLLMRSMFIRRYDASNGRCGDKRGMADIGASAVPEIQTQVSIDT